MTGVQTCALPICWRRALLDAAWRHPGLDSDAIPSILEAALLPEVLQFNLQEQLRFPFLEPEADEEGAMAQLIGLIDTLGAEHELGEQLAMLDAEAQGAVAEADEGRYGRVELERAEIRDQQQKLLETAFALGERE